MLDIVIRSVEPGVCLIAELTDALNRLSLTFLPSPHPACL